MDLNVGAVLRVLTHELRTPISVIHGYTRMLADHRLDADSEPRVLAQMQQAANRIAALGRDASDMARWLADGRGQATKRVPIADALTRAIGLTDLGSRVRVELPVPARALAVDDDLALATALATTLRAVAREALSKDVVIRCRPAAASAVDVIITAADNAGGDAPGPDAPTARPIDLTQGGLGLSLILAATVLDAHGAQLWSPNGRNDTIGVRLPTEDVSSS